MADIKDEASFKSVLEGLSLPQQRAVGAEFVRRVLDLTDDFRLKQGVDCATNPNASPGELLNAYRAARSAEVETYTACGQRVDWAAMAAHYVASAVAACVAPAETVVPGIDIPAYKAAMGARMARNSAMLAQDHHGECIEIAEQYRILSEYLK